MGVVVVVVIVGMGTRHVVGRKPGYLTAGVDGMRVIGMVPDGARVGWGRQRLALDLLRGLGQHGDIHAVARGWTGEATRIVAYCRWWRRRRGDGIGSVRVRRRDVGRGHGRGGGGSDGLGGGRRRHHVGLHSVDHAVMMVLLLFGASPRVGVVVYPRVTSQFVGTGELFTAPRKLASVGFLSGVCADVACLMLEAVEGLVAERTLVGAREFVGGLRGLASGDGPVWPDDGDGCHIPFTLLLLLLLQSALLLSAGRGVRIE